MMTDPIRRKPSPTPASRRRHSGAHGLVVLAVIGAIAVAAITAPGCARKGPDRAPVSGKVTYKGQPLRFGTVMFETEAGQYATGAIQPDGTFQMEIRGEGRGAPVGKSKVRIVCFANQDPTPRPGETANDPKHGEERGLGASLIPTKYSSTATSGIAVDVKPGNNEPLVLELTDP